MTLAVVVGQLPVTWDLATNREMVVSFLRAQASPGDLVVLPEAALTGYDDELSGLADLDPAQVAASVEAVGGTVRDLGVHLLCGALLPGPEGWMNCVVYLGPHGRRWAYQKVNLATHERGRLVAGSSLPLLPLAMGEPETRVGVQLCRELLFPEQWHVLAREGAQVLAYLTYAANPRVPAGVWRSHLISRAAETQRFVVAANVAHPDQHCPSMVISPRGEVLAETASWEPQGVRVELDLGAVSDWYLSQQRADVVAISYPAPGNTGA